MVGWIKVHRKLMDKSFYSKDSEKVHLWIHILMKANHSGKEESLGGKPFKCEPGQFTTGRKQLSIETGIGESKIERMLTYFEKIEQQIEQQKTTVNRLISVCNWSIYQNNEQPFEQESNNDRTASEQRVNTPKEVDNDNNRKNGRKKGLFVPPTISEAETYFTENGYKKESAKKFIEYYSVADWKDSKGNQVRNWKQKAQAVWFKDENKITPTNQKPDFTPKYEKI